MAIRSGVTKGDPGRENNKPSANNPQSGPLRPPGHQLLKPTHLAKAESNVDKKD
jgi:hypothetical protein